MRRRVEGGAFPSLFSWFFFLGAFHPHLCICLFFIGISLCIGIALYLATSPLFFGRSSLILFFSGVQTKVQTSISSTSFVAIILVPSSCLFCKLFCYNYMFCYYYILLLTTYNNVSWHHDPLLHSRVIYGYLLCFWEVDMYKFSKLLHCQSISGFWRRAIPDEIASDLTRGSYGGT